MLVFRSFALGLLGTCVLLLVMRPHYELRFVREAPILNVDGLCGASCLSEPFVRASIIDVAPSVPPAQLTQLLHLTVDEHVIAVDDVSVQDDLEAGVRIAQISPARNRFVDLTVASAGGPRRVLVLLH